MRVGSRLLRPVGRIRDATVTRVPETTTSALFPARDERERCDDLLTRALLHADERVAAGPVTPRLDVARFRDELAGFDYSAPRPLDEVLSWTIAQLECGVVHMTNPRYFGLFNPAPTFPAQCADRITAAFNPQLATATTSPAAVAIEAHVVRAIAARIGLPEGAGGHFTNAGSEANFTALLCALTRANPKFAMEGARAFSGPPTFYTSRECHLGWVKFAHMAGIGRAAVRFVPTDGSGRMDPQALSAMVEDDRASGHVPVMIAATAGTTNAGMIDPLPACADIARARDLWFHVDAAWGGALIASERLRGKLAGIERADSVTIDAHKWLATTMGCGMLIVRDAALLAATFQVSNDFMPSHVASTDPYMTSVQWSRRFLGLRLFLSLAAAGWQGYAAHVERAVTLIRTLAEDLAKRGWTIANDPQLAVLCLEPPAERGDARAIVRDILASGEAWISAASFEKRDVIRICATHGETTPADVAILVRALQGEN